MLVRLDDVPPGTSFWSSMLPRSLDASIDGALAPSERVSQPKPGDLPHLVLAAHQQLGEPHGVVPDVQPPDQRHPVGVRPLEHLEQLPRGWLAMRSDDAFPDVIH